jgi:2-deoxy-scyllo-inosamine dehydrogenase (SAM-dependent)
VRSPLFQVVEIEVNSRCNRRCSYCPVALDPRPAVPVRMADAVFDELVGQLGAVGFDGRVSYHFYNEPLLRTDLESLVESMAVAVPGAIQVLYTNGDRLDDERYERLRAAGVDYFVVTLHGGTTVPPRPFQVLQTGQDLVLTNRGGLLTDLPGPTAALQRTPCFAPSEIAIVTVTGDVLLCYEDANRSVVMGNVMDRPLAEIWDDERFVDARQALARGERERFAICASCSNAAHHRPGLSLTAEPLRSDDKASAESVVELKRRSVLARAQALAGR